MKKNFTEEDLRQLGTAIIETCNINTDKADLIIEAVAGVLVSYCSVEQVSPENFKSYLETISKTYQKYYDGKEAQ